MPELRLLAILAHPDDESLGVGGTLARYAAEGVHTYLVTATRGEAGRFGDGTEHPGRDALAGIREAELLAAARELGVRDVEILGYDDGGLDRADAVEATDRIQRHIRRIRPHVIITFDPFGAYGHPDHVAISQLATGAAVAAAHGAGAAEDPPHAAAKLYYNVMTRAKWDVYQTVFKRLVSRVDGVEREAFAWPDWNVTTWIDTAEHWPTVWRAVQHHTSQLAIYRGLAELSDEQHRVLWGSQLFCRAFSTVNGGRARETDLFAGLR
jgi:LmbE family N-acetylglucosaminyl deacetylase